MQSSLIHGSNGSMPDKAMMPMINGRPDYQLAEALTKDALVEVGPRDAKVQAIEVKVDAVGEYLEESTTPQG